MNKEVKRDLKVFEVIALMTLAELIRRTPPLPPGQELAVAPPILINEGSVGKVYIHQYDSKDYDKWMSMVLSPDREPDSPTEDFAAAFSLENVVRVTRIFQISQDEFNHLYVEGCQKPELYGGFNTIRGDLVGLLQHYRGFFEKRKYEDPPSDLPPKLDSPLTKEVNGFLKKLKRKNQYQNGL